MVENTRDIFQIINLAKRANLLLRMERFMKEDL
jgi:hypothetical protein